MIRRKSILLLVAVLYVLGMCGQGCRVCKCCVADWQPTAPDYADSSQWYSCFRHGEADLFYIISTETGDYALADGTVVHYADTRNDSVRALLLGEMVGVDMLVSGNLNYFSPYYRQCTIQTFTSDSLMAARMPVAQEDVRLAFDYYLKHVNNGRPFVLAGFSQGAMILLHLLRNMDEETYRRMVAAYVIGASVPKKMVDGCPYIVPAQGAEDTGVTISYNSVRNAQGVSPLFANSTIAINPVNWRTDSTAATLITVPSPGVPADKQHTDTLTVHLDQQTNNLFVDGFTDTNYMVPLIGKEGNYHSREIWLYRTQLRENMARRVENFLRLKKDED